MSGGVVIFWGRHRKSVIAQGQKISGNFTADGEIELHGEIEGELFCNSLNISENGRVVGKIKADEVTINGTVLGPIYGGNITLGPKARVTGDVFHESFSIMKGAVFGGSSRQQEIPSKPDKKKSAKKVTKSRTSKPRTALKRSKAGKPSVH